jgi:hypothetical protein
MARRPGKSQRTQITAPRPVNQARIARSVKRRTFIDTFSEYEKIGRVNQKALVGQEIDHTKGVAPSQKRVLSREKPLSRQTCKQRPTNNKSKGGNSRRYVPYCTKKG